MTKLEGYLKSNGHSRRWLADQTAINYYRVCKIVRGAQARGGEALKISKVLNAPLADLFIVDGIVEELLNQKEEVL